MSIEAKVKQFKKTLSLFPNPQEKYQYLIEQAKLNEDFPTELRIDEFKVNGCQSQVWLVPEEREEKLHFSSDSDALIAKGLVTLIASIYSDESAQDIASSEIDLMDVQINKNQVFQILSLTSSPHSIFLLRKTYIQILKPHQKCLLDCYYLYRENALNV